MTPISVIIPCFNNEEFVQKAIQSALAQGSSQIELEVIVIDDGSEDFSLDVIKSMGKLIHWETQSNHGAPMARNRGLSLAKGKYVKFLDADDVLLPGSLETQVSLAEQLPNHLKAVIYGNAQRVDHQGKLLKPFLHRPRLPDEDPIAHILSNCPLTSCPLHRRDYLNDIGGFNPQLKKGQEHDLHLRLVLSGVQFIHHDNDVYQYRDGSGDDRRISSQRLSSHGPSYHYDVFTSHLRLIESRTEQPLSEGVKEIMARKFWAYGRALLREGYSVEARKYFQTATHLDRNCVVGRFPYPLLVKFLRPNMAERLMEFLKS